MAAYTLWEPQAKQAQALSCPAFELFYGGARGGGKSDFLLADFVSGVNEWRAAWRGILFRRTYPELEELIRRAKELYLPLGATYHKQEKLFKFPTGAFLRMANLEREDDVTRYQGHQFTWIGFDELGNYSTDYCWIYMMADCRSSAGAPCYMRGTGNPGGRGHAWIKNRFIDGYEPGKIHKVPIADRYITRCFIPASLYDNTLLMEMNPEYEAQLLSLPDHLRRAFLDGDWDIFAGQVFEEFRRERHIIKPIALPQGQWYKFYAFDWGYSRPYALVKLAVNGDGKMIQYGEIYGCKEGEVNTGIRQPSREIARIAWEHAVVEGVTEIICDPMCWSKQDDNPTQAENFIEAGFIAVPAKNDRVPGWAALHERLQLTDEYERPMLQFFDTCYHTIRTLPILTPDPHNAEDVDSDLEDHLADALRYAVMTNYARHPPAAVRRNAGTPKKYSVMDNWRRVP